MGLKFRSKNTQMKQKNDFYAVTMVTAFHLEAKPT